MSHNAKRVAWGAMAVLAALLVLDDPPPTWLVWLSLFTLSFLKYQEHRDKAKRQREDTDTWGS